MLAAQTDPLAAFHWTPQPQAQALVKQIIADFLGRSSFAAALAWKMRDEAGTRFIDWIDHLVLPISAELAQRLQTAGFIERDGAFVHDGGIFPAILLRDDPHWQAALKVESVADFLSVWQIPSSEPIGAPPLAALRKARVAVEKDAQLWVIERHGYRGFASPRWSAEQAVAVLQHQEAFRRRPRKFNIESEGFTVAAALIDAAIADLGVGYAADLFFAAEREYWQRRNRAARAQKARQDRLGLGWANHDHHTYRSSRAHFAPMIALFEKLGLTCRERFYAGAEAGWGAQVMESPSPGFVVFADVDLSPDELREDFAHQGLSTRHELGTVGLWCALHGEAILQAGMHHLECQFDFDALKGQFEQNDQIKVMKPFTDFSYLRQAFTEAEIWPVEESRVAALLASAQITPAQAEQFRRCGAVGSHLENLERNDGFKGFNQQGVSEIIARTDPRRAR
jgi:hypothetical protein